MFIFHFCTLCSVYTWGLTLSYSFKALCFLWSLLLHCHATLLCMLWLSTSIKPKAEQCIVRHVLAWISVREHSDYRIRIQTKFDYGSLFMTFWKSPYNKWIYRKLLLASLAQVFDPIIPLTLASVTDWNITVQCVRLSLGCAILLTNALQIHMLNKAVEMQLLLSAQLHLKMGIIFCNGLRSLFIFHL